MSAKAYSKQNNDMVYARLLDEARQALAEGMPVIVDSVFADPAERDAVARLGAKQGIDFNGRWLHAPREIMLERVAGRHDDASDADGTVIDCQLGQDVADLARWSRRCTAGSPGDVLERALELLAMTLTMRVLQLQMSD